MPVYNEILLHEPSEVIQQLLADMGVGIIPDGINQPVAGSWPIYHNQIVDHPDEIIVVHGTQGTDEGRYQPTGERLEHPGIQVLVRSKDAQVGYQKAEDIATKLDRNVNNAVTTIVDSLGSTQYLVYAVGRTGNVIPVGTENPKSWRKVFTVNAICTIDRLT